MIAQYSNGKLETVLYIYITTTQKMEEKEKELNCWHHSVLEQPNGKLQQINFTLTFCFTLLENELFTKKKNRRFCRLPRSNTFWWESVWNNHSDDRFKQTFCLSHSTFTFILSHKRHKLVKEYVAEEPISPEKRLGICLYRLARGDYLYTVAEMVGLAESTVCKIVIEVCNAILENLWTYAVNRHFPKSVDDFCNKLQEMACEWQFKYALAAIALPHQASCW